MGHYTYYARNFFTNSGDYPLLGAHYKQLVQCCFHHSSYVSFLRLAPNSPFASELEKWKVDGSISTIDAVCDPARRCVYYACEELCQAMLSWTDDLFSLYNLMDHIYPEDPVFIRDDGTIFFDSIIHEGECSIYPRAGENVDTVLSYGHWLYINENGQPDVPARMYQFPFPDYKKVQKDQLYKELRSIQRDPLAHLPVRSIDAITAYIDHYRPPFFKNEEELPPGFTCLPDWYFAFRMYVLGECDASTCTEIPDALESKGFGSAKGFNRYFQLLDQYMRLIGMPD